VSTFVASVEVMLKSSVNDPQGLSIRNALHALGFAGVSDVRAGKRIVITVEADDAENARAQVTAMSEKLLANPVIETFEVRIGEPVA
jgi:phosphoribosylformylglycinamidine synthase PurS subunit